MVKIEFSLKRCFLSSALGEDFVKNPHFDGGNLIQWWYLRSDASRSKQLFKTSRLSVLPSIRLYVGLSHFYFFLIPAVVSQNHTDDSCLACVKSEKYVVWVTFRPLGFIRLGEAELRQGLRSPWLRTLQYHLPRVGYFLVLLKMFYNQFSNHFLYENLWFCLWLLIL